MKTRTVSMESGWRNLCNAALVESDRSKVLALISEAEAEIVKRSHLLFGAPGDHFDETEDLDDALYMLRALENCVKIQAMDQLAA